MKRKICLILLIVTCLFSLSGCHLTIRPHYMENAELVDKQTETNKELGYNDTHYYFYLREISGGFSETYRWEVYKSIYDKYEIHDFVNTEDFNVLNKEGE